MEKKEVEGFRPPKGGRIVSRSKKKRKQEWLEYFACCGR